MSMRDEMIKAFKREWAIIPLKMNSKEPNLPKGHKFLTEKPTKHDYKTWSMTQCFDNYGIVTGQLSGITVVDVDFPYGLELVSNLGIDLESIETPQVLTPKGRHLYFKYTPKVRTGVAVMGRGIDIRNNGAYVVGPGSSVDGESYVWSDVYGPDTPLREIPLWLEESRRSNGGSEWKLTRKLGEGERNSKLTSLAGALLIRELPMPLVLESLLLINEKWCEVPLDRGEIEHIAKSVERYRDQAEHAEKAKGLLS